MGDRFRIPPPPKPTLEELRLVARMFCAGVLSWWVATLFGADRPLFAVLVPLVAISGDPFSAVSVSAARAVGVFAGVFLGLALYSVHVPSTALVALLLALSLGAGLLLRTHGGPVNNQVAITAMFMLYLGAAAKAETVGVQRIWETAIGAAVAVAVAAVAWPPDPLGEARRRVARLRAWVDEDVAAAARLVAAPDAEGAEAQLELVRERSLQAVRAVFDVERGEQALRWNPRHRADREAFAAERLAVGRAARQYRHLRTITRIVADLAEAGPPLSADERTRLAAAVAARHADPARFGDARAV
ncbi:MAG: FUSC family protein, partial [Actinomycetota bacterium]